MVHSRLLTIVDLVVVVVLAGTAWGQIWTMSDGQLEGGRLVHAVLLAACTLPLLVRRRFALVVFVTVLAAGWLQFELGGGLGQPFFASLLAWYSVGAHASSPSTYAGPAAVVLQVALVDVPRLRDGAPLDEVVPAWFVLLGIWGFGRWMRRRVREAETLRASAEASDLARAEQTRLAVADERARIARELHDLVAHSMGVIVIQAQGAQRALDSSPEQARDALTSIENAGRGGMAEMRRLLGLLTETDDGSSTAPQPSLEQLPALVEQVRAAGLQVNFAVEGDVRPLPPGLELTGYRVVQEAMTNVLKHAGETVADIRVRYDTDSLDISICDQGHGAARDPDTAGHGLVGMRERVSLYGGSLQTGPRPEGGFGVHAQIPVDGGRA